MSQIPEPRSRPAGPWVERPAVGFEPLLNEHDAAAMLGVSEHTLARFRRTGGGPKFVQLGARVRYEPRALRQWIAAHSYGSMTELLAHDKALAAQRERRRAAGAVGGRLMQGKARVAKAAAAAAKAAADATVAEPAAKPVAKPAKRKPGRPRKLRAV